MISKKDKEIALSMNNEDMFTYITRVQKSDKNYGSVIRLLVGVIDSYEDVYKIVRYSLRNNKKLHAIYPELGEEPTQNMKYLGSIIDGALYIDK